MENKIEIEKLIPNGYSNKEYKLLSRNYIYNKKCNGVLWE
jgi:hypothetical protein